MTKLYVGNLPYSINDQALSDLFASYGDVTSAVVITDRATGRSKGFGFVEFEDDAAATAAIEGMNESEVEGRNLKVNVARPKSE